MIANIEPTATKASAPIYHLKVVLIGTKPPIWRRLQVPGNANLGWLHAVLQVAMGWTNSHLHQFRVGELLYSDLRHNSPEFEGDPEILDENKAPSSKSLRERRTRWVTNTTSATRGSTGSRSRRLCRLTPQRLWWRSAWTAPEPARPRIAAASWGYDNLLKIIRNPKHEEHDSMMEWLGAGFDPEAFDADEANTYLRKLKWPRVTEDQLRKVLMARDDYRE